MHAKMQQVASLACPSKCKCMLTAYKNCLTEAQILVIKSSQGPQPWCFATLHLFTRARYVLLHNSWELLQMFCIDSVSWHDTDSFSWHPESAIVERSWFFLWICKFLLHSFISTGSVQCLFSIICLARLVCVSLLYLFLFSFLVSSFFLVCFSFLMFLLCDSVSCQLIDSVSWHPESAFVENSIYIFLHFFITCSR